MVVVIDVSGYGAPTVRDVVHRLPPGGVRLCHHVRLSFLHSAPNKPLRLHLLRTAVTLLPLSVAAALNPPQASSSCGGDAAAASGGSSPPAGSIDPPTAVALPLRCSVLKALIRSALAHDELVARQTAPIFTFSAGTAAARPTAGGASPVAPLSPAVAAAASRRISGFSSSANPFTRAAEALRSALYDASDLCPVCFRIHHFAASALAPPAAKAGAAAGAAAAAARGGGLPHFRRLDPALASQRPPSRQLRPCPPWDPHSELCLEAFENEWRHGSLAVGIAPLLAVCGGAPAALSAAFAAAAAESASSGITQASQVSPSRRSASSAVVAARRC